MTLNLSSLTDQEDLTRKISPSSLSQDSGKYHLFRCLFFLCCSSQFLGNIANAVATTALQLHLASNKQLNSFIPDHLTVIAPNASSQPGASALDFLRDLVLSAEKAATSLACSSILLGQTSESDYLGDLAIFLGSGDFGEGHEEDVIKTLGLQTYTQHNITPISLETSDKLPLSVSSNPNSSEIQPFVDKIKCLEGRYCFRLSKHGSEGSVVTYFLVGKINDAWVALCGMGTWSDE
ncbi:hypothetical protein DL96DRAFT_1463829 [Flagelloscypha sp. PMI_526]|nr:hypothetical protein DL96DRAFT_1463829 [Flagelloscypha sp. PMI_526]